jgi:hypothetical protein
VESLDQALARAWEIFIDDLSDETDAELEDLLSPLAAADYVTISGDSLTGHFWSFTPEGVKRSQALGLD